MYRALAVGAFCILLGASVVSVPAAEKHAEKHATKKAKNGCGCSAAQSGTEIDSRSLCICLYYEYAEYFNANGQLVHCYYGMYCDDYSAGTTSWEDTAECPTTTDQCTVGCGNLSEECMSLGRAALARADSEMKSQRKPHRMKPEVARLGAKAIEPSDPVLTSHSDESLGISAGPDGAPVFGKLSLDGRETFVRMQLVKIEINKPGFPGPRVVYFGFGRQCKRKPATGTPITVICPGQIEHVSPDPQAGKTRTLFVTHKGILYLLLLETEVGIPK